MKKSNKVGFKMFLIKIIIGMNAHTSHFHSLIRKLQTFKILKCTQGRHWKSRSQPKGVYFAKDKEALFNVAYNVTDNISS